MGKQPGFQPAALEDIVLLGRTGAGKPPLGELGRQAPLLGELGRHAGQLRAMTGGLGRFDIAPHAVQHGIAGERAPGAEEA